MKNKLQTLQQRLSSGLINRDDEIKLALLTLIAGENLLLVGPPGTAKSMIARRMAKALAPQTSENNTTDYFEYLLTKFSTPEEIFGPLSISELKQDRFVRNTAHYLPTARVAFLDEIFKASSSILNALLTILNERKYHNGTATQDIPLQMLIAASNELPTGQEELSALYDRFLVRKMVDYLDDTAALFALPIAQEILPENQLTKAELDDIRQKAVAVEFPDEIRQVILAIWREHKELFKEDTDEFLSDRKLVKVLHLLRISAATNEREAVDLSDVMLLKDCLWNGYDDDKIQKIRNLIVKELKKADKLIKLEQKQHNNRHQPTSTNTKPQSDTQTQKQSTQPSKIKGYQGSGAKEDPILISNVSELFGLQRPDVGQQDYYFKQTADIDCSEIDAESWAKIDFKGHYDGQGFFIKHKTYITPFNYITLFNIVKEAKIYNMVLKNMGIADIIASSQVISCSTNATMFYYIKEKCEMFDITARQLAGDISDSQFKYVKVDSIAHTASDSDFQYCQTGYSFFKRSENIFWWSKIGEAKNITVENCIIAHCNIDDETHYGIAMELDKSTIKNCLITTVSSRKTPSDFYAFANSAKSTTIENCMIGHIDKSFTFKDFILNSNNSSNITINNTYYLDKNRPQTNELKLKCQPISEVLFNQYHFEHTLGWDFENVWEWDMTNNEPKLRDNIASDAQNSTFNSQLAEQLKNNIWL